MVHVSSFCIGEPSAAGMVLCSVFILESPSLSAISASRSTRLQGTSAGAAKASAGKIDEAKDNARRLWRMFSSKKVIKNEHNWKQA